MLVGNTKSKQVLWKICAFSLQIQRDERDIPPHCGAMLTVPHCHKDYSDVCTDGECAHFFQMLLLDADKKLRPTHLSFNQF